ncbi:CMRF35-like molecule 8 isoform X2 [Dicentrarchus labrax]|uniref:CMRF35-like molecule 8 isoform X2 n=1 Tax=Dicentrarchus labrax TaxID=13489 RepID=UPI0021F54C50|nr:CMRF35-like molecule 8 isoform X2 [Dicentrarchus labrax]
MYFKAFLSISCFTVPLHCVTSAADVINAAGYTGRELKVSCPYQEGYDFQEKYLCRNECDNDDEIVIKTTEVKKGKYSILDDKKKQIFTVTISDLDHTDAGKYRCMMTKVGVDPSSAEVHVEVVPDTCCDRPNKVQGYETGSVSFSCPYESKYRTNIKYICRGNQSSTCLQQALITSDHKRNRQFTLTDDTTSRKFTVTIKSLTQRDSGPYLCGVHGNTGLDVFSAVELEVKALPKQTTVVTTLITVEPVSSTSQATQISEKPTKDAAPSSCLLLTVLAVVALLLSLAFGLVMVYKYCKLQGVGVVMNRNMWKATEAEEMTAVVDIYGFEDDMYSHLDSYKQSTL